MGKSLFLLELKTKILKNKLLNNNVDVYILELKNYNRLK